MYPSSKAIGISHHTGNTDPGNMANTTAITSPKIAIIIHSSRNTITKNRNRVRVLTYLEVYSAIDFPWFLMELSLIHISEPTRRTPISYAVFCLKKKKQHIYK